MPPLFTRSLALLLVVTAIVLGRNILVAGDEQKRSPFGGSSVSMSGHHTAPSRHPSKTKRSTMERSRTRGTVHGFDPQHRYTHVPDLTVKWTNLPPKSRGHVRTYLGAPTSDPVGTQVLPGSEVVNNDRVPRNRTVELRDLNDQFKKEGPYTIELVQETGPNTAIVCQLYPLKVDRTSFETIIFTGGF